ncbi:hypothetical protein D3C76_549410 [compost metagenome]
MGVQPLAALGQGLGVGVDAADAVGLGVFTDQQVMVDTQLDFAADHHVMFEEAVEGVVDRAFGGVFHRHDAKVHRPGRHFTEHFVDRRHRLADHRVTEVFHRCSLGEGAFRAEVSHFQRLLQRQARGHDFAEKPRHLFVAQRPLIALHHALEHLSFALRTIEHRHFAFGQRGHLYSRDFLGATRTLTDQLKDFGVQSVNTNAQCLEFLLGHQPCSFSNSAMYATSALTAVMSTAL